MCVPSVGKGIRNKLLLNPLPRYIEEKMGIMLQNITLLFPSCFILWIVLPLDFIKIHHFVPCDSLFHPRFWRDAQYKKDQVREGVLQFPPLPQELINTSSTGRQERNYVLLTKYSEVGDDKQQYHTAPKFYKVQHNEELTSYRCFELPPTSKFLVLRVWFGWRA